jgi:hypothetical protein
VRMFETEQEFLDAVADEWRRRAPPTDLITALTAGLQRADAALTNETPAADAGLNLKLKGWVLRTEDLPVIEAIGIAGAAASAALAPSGIAAAAVITAISSFGAMCWKAWRKGAQLNRDEIAVLSFLEIHGPMDLDELKRKASDQLKNLSSSAVAKALRSLTDVELRDGEIVSLVRRDASGRWRSQGV